MLWLIGVLQCSYAITLVYNGIDVNVFAHMPYVPFPAEDKRQIEGFFCAWVRNRLAVSPCFQPFCQARLLCTRTKMITVSH